VFYRSFKLVQFTGRDCGPYLTGSNFIAILWVMFLV